MQPATRAECFALNQVMSSFSQFKCILKAQELLEAKEAQALQFHSMQTTFFDEHIPNISGKGVPRHDNLKKKKREKKLIPHPLHYLNFDLETLQIFKMLNIWTIQTLQETPDLKFLFISKE